MYGDIDAKRSCGSFPSSVEAYGPFKRVVEPEHRATTVASALFNTKQTAEQAIEANTDLRLHVRQRSGLCTIPVSYASAPSVLLSLK